MNDHMVHTVMPTVSGMVVTDAGGGEAEQQQRVSSSPPEPAAAGVREARGDEEALGSGVGVSRLLHLQHLRLPEGETQVLIKSLGGGGGGHLFTKHCSACYLSVCVCV